MTPLLLVVLLAAAPLKPAGSAKPAGSTAPAPKVGPPWDLIWMVDPPDSSPAKPAPPPSAHLRRLGDALYQERCESCHGGKGDGQGGLAAKLRPRPTDFTRAVFKLRSTPAGTLPTDGDLFRTLSRGIHGTAMQPWRHLTEEERWALVLKLKSFSPRFRSEAPGQPIKVPAAPAETDRLRDRGAILYIRMGCGACHGTTGEGDGPARTAGIRDFSRGRFIRGIEMEDVFLTLRVGIEGTAMAAYDGVSDEDLWALAAYIRVLLREEPLHELPPVERASRAPCSSPPRRRPRRRPGVYSPKTHTARGTGVAKCEGITRSVQGPTKIRGRAALRRASRARVSTTSAKITRRPVETAGSGLEHALLK
jgi:mono/diheme cytochrome c family protein